MIAKPTPFNTIFWQWVNQTYMAGYNYSNRNATSPCSTNELIFCYLLATSVSVFLSLKIRSSLAPFTSKMSGPKLVLSNTFSAFVACSAAGLFNSVIMRRGELQKGIDVFDEGGNLVGKSTVAAKKAVFQTSYSRVLLALPMFITPLGLMALERARMMPGSWTGQKIAALIFMLTDLYFSAPLATALFPQQGKIRVGALEEQFH
mmetsp:Transcript_15516/g.11299  ORF Transcript_15516/g.11299 Transcript_15516/m.11299 type:complete len:204 (+) Transcript_15516:404-1015(+)